MLSKHTTTIKNDRYKIVHVNDPADPVAIRFENVSKLYRLYKNDRQRFTMLFSKRIRRSLKTRAANSKLNFTIKKGETVNLIGANGAGKSTCLKIIAGTAFPSSGKVYINGEVGAAFTSVGGFDVTMSGRDFVRYKCEIMGIGRAKSKELIPQVIDFTEIGDYIDQPVKTYSAGMKARLGVSFALMLRPEILIVDEALSVGDRTFAKKCKNEIAALMANEKITVLFVSHSPTQAKDFCKRGIILKKGRIVFDGDIDEAEARYEKM
jgi:teichoic acid transport system ATP-binding protein